MLHTCRVSPTINIPPLEGIFVTINEPTPAHHHHPKSAVHIRVHFMHCRRQWHPTPMFLPGESQGRGSLVGCSAWGSSELGKTEQLHFHFSLSCTGEGYSTPLQCSCLENPRDRGAWWAAIYGVTQSQTRLKRLSSSSSSMVWYMLCVRANVHVFTIIASDRIVSLL